MDETFLVAYESIGLDVGESLEQRLPYLQQVIDQTRTEIEKRQRQTKRPHRLMVGVDVIGGAQETGAAAVAETFGALVDLLNPDDDVYVAWNPQDEPRFVRDALARGQETSPPAVYVLRISGSVESAGVDLSQMGLLRGSRGGVEQ